MDKVQLISMIHFLEERDEQSKKENEALKKEKKYHQPSALLHRIVD